MTNQPEQQEEIPHYPNEAQLAKLEATPEQLENLERIEFDGKTHDVFSILVEGDVERFQIVEDSGHLLNKLTVKKDLITSRTPISADRKVVTD